MPKTKRKKSLMGWTIKNNLDNPNINNLNFYPSQPCFINGKLDNTFLKVRITIQEV